MLVVYNAFDDNTADIIDITNMTVKFYTEQQLINLNKHHNVLGIISDNRKLYSIHSYNMVSFPTENEAIVFAKVNNIELSNMLFINGYYWVFQKQQGLLYVNYYVYNQKGEECTYLCIQNNKATYTPYIQEATVFDKKEAQKRAKLMTMNSKTGTYWKALRIVVG